MVLANGGHGQGEGSDEDSVVLALVQETRGILWFLQLQTRVCGELPQGQGDERNHGGVEMTNWELTVDMIQRCAKGQRSQLDWSCTCYRMDSRLYDLCPGAYLDPGPGSANRYQPLLSIREDGLPLE